VQYATADNPLGHYTYQGCVLETNADGTVHGPGHHSILQQGDDYYIVYHRHDNPHSNRGFHRQVCIDKMNFTLDGKIEKIVPTHQGVGALAPVSVKSRNIAYNKPVKASSYYDADFKPEYAVDDNNGTLWRPATMGQEWIEIDLQKVMTVKTIWTQWEYGTQFYQYLIETSKDGKTWAIYADKRDNRLAGSPMTDFGDAQARYVRITFTGGQKCGFPGAIWNVKVYSDVEESAPQQWIGVTAADWNGREWKNNQGQLGGAFTLKSGSAIAKRVDGKDALVLSPGTVLEYNNSLLSPAKPHTLTAVTYKEGKWQPYNMSSSLTKGSIKIAAGAQPLIITNVRYYNWQLHPAEIAHDMTTDIVRMPVADTNINGVVVSINADNYAVGDTIGYIPNEGVISGEFEARRAPVVVKEIEGKKGFEFDGNQEFISNFSLPATLRDNAPYTLEAWILNPEIAVNECIADFTTSHDELEKIMMVNGTEPRCGVMQHYGWYEDAGWKDVKSLEGKWQHLYVCFDGRIERVYINDKLISEKDIQLLVKPSQYIILGHNAEGDWPFTGYVNSIILRDEYIPYKSIK
jgi:hypothetical protein